MPPQAPTTPATPAPVTAPVATTGFRAQVPHEVVALLAEAPLGYELEAREDQANADELETVRLSEPPVAAAPVTPASPAPVSPAPVAAAPAPVADPTIRGRAQIGREIASRVESTIERARRRYTIPKVPDLMSEAEWDTFKTKAREKIGKAEDFGEAAVQIFNELRELDKRQADRLRLFQWNIRLAGQTDNARDQYADFDEVLTEAGIWAGIPDERTGVAENLGLFKEIYGQDDPPITAYWTGIGVLAQRAGKTPEAYFAERQAKLGHSGTPPVPAPARQAAPSVVPATVPSAVPAAEPIDTEGLAPAEIARRAAARALEGVASASARPRGLRGLESAGEPVEMALSVAQLDALMTRNPTKYLELVEKNHGLDMFHMSGGESFT